MTTRVFRRPPRLPGPEVPQGELALESPPELSEQATNAARYLMVLPMLAGAGAMAFLYAGRGGGPLTYVVGALFGVSMLGMVVMSLITSGGNKKAELNQQRRDYMRKLDGYRKRVRRYAKQQRAAVRWRHPDPDTLWTTAASRRLWERRRADEDFAEVRLSTGTAQLAVQLLQPEEHKPVEDLEPMSAGALYRFMYVHKRVTNQPMALNLRAYGRVVVAADRSATLSLTRALLGQLVTFHAPDDLRIVVVAAPERWSDWDWTKWLPHVQHPEENDLAGGRRMVFATLAEAEEVLGEELAGRGPHNPTATALTSHSHVIVLLDGGEVAPTCQLADAGLGGGLAGATVVDLSGVVPRGADVSLLRLEVSNGELLVSTGESRSGVSYGTADRLSAQQALGLARHLAPYRLSARQAGDDGEDELATSTELPDLLKLGDAAALDPAQTWQPRPLRDRLRIPLGVDPSGTMVEIDFKESAQNGMGPHGLCIGATGSGKSELLRTVVAALAVTHSPEELNFVLVDFKGGATFASLDVLPHTSAVITNLADELPLVDRMQDALAGEMVRRQEVLRAAGNYVSRFEYEKAREAGAPLEPMPSLMIICDEFSELLSAKPDFIDLFVMIGRLGRSLGVHLLLASQRLEEGRLRGLDTHLSYRIGLRTFSAAESRIVLGVQDAYELPNAPGHGYLKTDTQTMLRFRAAYVSGPYQPADTAPRRQLPAAEQPPVVPYGLDYLSPPQRQVEQEAEPVAVAEETPADGKQQSMLDVLVARLQGHGPAAHQVWLPPLAEPPSMDSLLPRLVNHPDYGLSPHEWPQRGQLVVPVGIVDKPYEQRRDPMLVELDGAGGNVVVVGGPQSGKSTMLRALIGSLALTHTPREVQFFCLDFGGGALRAFDGLPHLSGVAGRRDAEAVRRTVAEVSALLEQREARFTDLGIDSITTYRRRLAAGEIDDPFGDVFLIVDGWGTLREDYEELEATIASLAARGLNFGIHVVLTAARWAEVRINMRDLFGTRLELRLGDPADSEIDRRTAANVPERSPGRGLSKDKLHFLTALARADGKSDIDDLTEAIGDLVTRIRACWAGDPAPKVRLLPRELTVAELRDLVDPQHPGIAIGLNEAQLAPVYLNFHTEPHLMAFGDAECGKTNLLRLVAQSIAQRYTPDEARLLIVDYQRHLLGAVTSDHLLEYAPSNQALSKALVEVRAALQQRLPPEDLTPAQLRERSWWRGPRLYVLVDDYDLVVSGMDNPLSALLELLPQARDIGLHLVLTRRVGGVSRALYEPVLQRLRELDVPGLLMSGNRDEGMVFGNVRPSPQPPGRGTLVRRSDGQQLIQTAIAEE